MYGTKAAAERAYAAYRAKEHSQEEVENVPYPNEHALRLKDPADFADKSFRRTHGSGKGMVQGVKVPASIDVIWGKLKDAAGADDPPIAQALRFKISKWDKEPDKAKKWISDNEVKGTFEAASGKEENASDTSVSVSSTDVMPTVSDNDLHVFMVAAEKGYRYEEWQGRKQLVVPVVGLVEGVHNGIFYPGEEIANYVEAWNGVPVPVYHPKDMENGVPVSCNDPMIVEQQCVGRLWNVSFDPEGAKMRGEVWIDVDKANELNSSIITTILQGGKMEVSTGLWGDHLPSTGEWNGEPYEYVLRNFRPDHLALLPGELGACSWEDGCGIRVNTIAKETLMPGKDKAREQLRGKIDLVLSLAKSMKLSVQEVSHDEIRHTLQDKLGELLRPPAIPATQPSLADAWVREVFDNFFIYEAAADGATKLYKQSYKVTNEEVALDGDPVEVELKVEYAELSAKQQDKTINSDGAKSLADASSNSITIKREVVNIMEKKMELINQLIQLKAFVEEDREMLTTLDEAVLTKMRASFETLQKKEPEPAKAEPVPEPAKAEPVVNKDEPKAEPVPEPKPKTPEEFIANAPDEMKEVLSAGLKMHRDKKAKLVKALLANKRNRFTEDQLKVKSVDELEALAELAAVEVDFSGNRPAPRPAELKFNERHEDGTGVPDVPAAKWSNDGRPDFSHLT